MFLFKSGRNARKSVRVKPEVDNPVRVDINGEDFLDIFNATNISEGGVGVMVPHRFDSCRIEEPVSLIVQLPSPVNKTFTATGQIRHIGDKLFGIAFLGVGESTKVLIREYIEHRLESEKSIA